MSLKYPVGARYLQYYYDDKYFCNLRSKIFLSKFPHLSCSAVSLYSWLCVLTVGSIISSRYNSTLYSSVALRPPSRYQTVGQSWGTRGDFRHPESNSDQARDYQLSIIDPEMSSTLFWRKKRGNNLWLCRAADLICIYHRLGSFGMRWYYQNEMRTLWRIYGWQYEVKTF